MRYVPLTPLHCMVSFICRHRSQLWVLCLYRHSSARPAHAHWRYGLVFAFQRIFLSLGDGGIAEGAVEGGVVRCTVGDCTTESPLRGALMKAEESE